jgi:ribonuclease HII
MSFEPIEIEYFKSNPGGIIAGFDEAGRGPLAGPVSVGMAVFPKDLFNNIPADLALLNDSKLVKPVIRESLYKSIKKHSLFYSVIHISNRKIDEIGINPSIELAISLALRRFSLFASLTGPHLALVDGNYKLISVKNQHPETEFQSLVKGDSRVFSIAAASILAKVSRDRRMVKFHRYFPDYGFDQHSGYGTAYHRKKISEMGYSDLHRKSYKLKEKLI